MMKFAPADMHSLSAAEGWMELGNPLEAHRELDSIRAEIGAHPIVLQLRWRIHSQAREWEQCIEIATRMIQSNPNDGQGLVNLGNSLYFSGRTQEAFDQVSAAMPRFPGNAILRYNLACYAAQLGRLDDARVWLDQACEIAKEPAKMKLMALDDPDLEPLWRNIGGLQR